MNTPPRRRRPRATRPTGLGQAARLGTCLLSLSLAACAVGPDYQTPEVPKAQAGTRYTEGPLPHETASTSGAGGTAQTFVPGQNIPAQWWALFGSPELDALVRQALANSPSLAAAQAALRQANETYSSVSGSLLYPSVGANLQAGHERASAVQTSVPGGVVYNLYNASVNVSYTLDIFGANRRTLEAQRAAVDYQRFQLEGTYLTLTANVVTTAIREAALRAQLQATRELLKAQEEQLDISEHQHELGAIGQLPLLAQRSAVAATRASVPAVEKALAQTRHLLAVLVGRLPSDAGLAAFDLDKLTLPPQLPLSLGSDLVRQRPDIRAAEAMLHQAAAQVGVATANLYPQVNLTASAGSSAFTSDQLFKSGWGFWSLMGGLTQPIFNGGALQARKRAASAGLEAAAAQYQGTVLQAFQNVADSLRALEFDASTLQQQAEAESFARRTLDLSTQQYQLGSVSYVALLDAQRSYQQARINLVNARAARYADSAALFQSLGGGWWNRTDTTPTPVADSATDH